MIKLTRIDMWEKVITKFSPHTQRFDLRSRELSFFVERETHIASRVAYVIAINDGTRAFAFVKKYICVSRVPSSSPQVDVAASYAFLRVSSETRIVCTVAIYKSRNRVYFTSLRDVSSHLVPARSFAIYPQKSHRARARFSKSRVLCLPGAVWGCAENFNFILEDSSSRGPSYQDSVAFGNRLHGK